MGIKIEAFRDSHVPAVAAFNARLQAGGVTISFPVDPAPAWLPKLAGRHGLPESTIVAVDDKAVVRGAYTLKPQQFRIRDQVVSLGQLPLAGFRRHRQPGLLARRRATAPRRAQSGNPCCSAWASAAAARPWRACWSPPAGASAPSLSSIASSTPSPFCGTYRFCGGEPPSAGRSMAWRRPGWGGSPSAAFRPFAANRIASIRRLPPKPWTTSPPGPTKSGKNAATTTVCRPCATPKPSNSCAPRTTNA